jgi:hypothetical protein
MVGSLPLPLDLALDLEAAFLVAAFRAGARRAGAGGGIAIGGIGPPICLFTGPPFLYAFFVAIISYLSFENRL